ncbi:MAG TPA: M28 family peptidase [Bacteroidota bacterium]
MRLVIRLMLLSGLLVSVAAAQGSPEDEMFGFVTALQGKSRQARSEFIKTQLTKMNAGFFTVPFDYHTVRGGDTLDLGGEDIVARVGQGRGRVVVGAHFDAAEGSPGANDNGSGVAVVLELIKTLKNYNWNCSIDFVFFDREENGMIGSQFYIQRVVNRNRHYGMINLDIEGTGDEVYVGPVGGGDDDFLMPMVRKTAKQTKYVLRETSFYPPSDFKSFVNMHLENISISVVPKGDAELLTKMTRSGGKIDAKDTPKIMKTIHTPNDRVDQMTPGALKISYEFTNTLLQMLNGSIR